MFILDVEGKVIASVADENDESESQSVEFFFAGMIEEENDEDEM
jgi:hypothetical protein